MNTSDKKSERVYCWIRTYIDEKKFGSYLKLPSENVLSRRLSVSRETIRTALARLAAEGLIYKIKGSGTYINKEVALTSELSSVGASLKIGLILQGQDTDANASLIEGIQSVFKKEQVDLRIFFTDNKFANERRCLQMVMHQDFQGFIVDGVKANMLNLNLDCYRQIYQKQIPVIFYNNYYKDLIYPHVTVNDKQCADRLLGMLIKAGHKHIAGIFNYDNYQSIEKFQGMTAAMKRYDVVFSDDYIKWYISNEINDAKFEKSLENFLKSLPRCTAIVCCNYMIYTLVRKVLEKQKKQVPQDYSVVCFDYSGPDWKKEGVACSVHQGKKIGQEAASHLLKMIERKECDGSCYSCVLPPKINTGDSIRQIKKSS